MSTRTHIAQRVPNYPGMTAEQLVKETGSKSAAIRHLNGLRWTRQQIADFLGIRYQHVRTVLITPLTGDTSGSRTRTGRTKRR